MQILGKPLQFTVQIVTSFEIARLYHIINLTAEKYIQS